MNENSTTMGSQANFDTQRTMAGNRNPDFIGTVDQYTLIRELGSGGFGVVFLAEDSFSHAQYALKTVLRELKGSSEELDNLMEKFRFVQKLYHPNIAAATAIHRVKEVRYGSDEVREKLRLSPGDPVMIMRYAPGETLSRWRKKFPHGRAPVDKAIEICRQIADALDYAHGEKVIHRDIKPGNIAVDEQAGALKVQILDFGLAAEVSASLARAGQSTVDTSGTRPYMAPEQWAGLEQDGRTDQYALGVVLYELVSGAVPFSGVFAGRDVEVMERKVLHDPVLTVNILSEVQNRALRKALAKSAANRFPTCRAFIDAFEGKATFTDTPVSPPATAPQKEEEAHSEPVPLPTPDEMVVQEGIRRIRASLHAGWQFCGAVFRTYFSPVRRFAVKNLAKILGRTHLVSVQPGSCNGNGPAAIDEPSMPSAVGVETWVSVLSRRPKPTVTTLDLGGGLSFEMVELPAGTFRMGSPNGRNGEPGRRQGESLHEVRLTTPFQLAAAPVTRAKWRAIMGDDPDQRAGGSDEDPVTGVSWDDCQKFLAKLNESHPFSGYQWGLPTEAQWEFACRAGTPGPYAGSGRIDDMGWYAGNADGHVHPVRQKQPNAWGLYDMHGNVWEWCADGYIPSLGYDTRTDPLIVASGMEHVVRGGSWNNNAAFCRSACRRGMVRTARFDSVGFRVALVSR